jgi:predicted MFS family arabinose efflux permease
LDKPNARDLYPVFTIFAAGYLLSSLLRGVTAALAPSFISEFNVDPAQLGLLAGAYFASFALLQLPMGAWLDRYGVRVVLLWSLTIAAASCVLFAMAQSFHALVAARILTGVGVSACLIAPLAAARLWTPQGMQQRVNAWMLMAGALGLVAGTLPAERIAAQLGWRLLFVMVGVLFLVVAFSIACFSPRQERKAASAGLMSGYGVVLRNPYIRSIGPMGFFNYSILVAVQTLWVGPWLTSLGGLTAGDAATRLMYINGIMLFVFLAMGYVSPKINKAADDSERILRTWTPLSVTAIFLIAYMGERAGWTLFAAYCVCAWPLSVTHPLVGQRFPQAQAGRALAFFNLLLFAGVFVWQWVFGIVVTKLQGKLGSTDAYRLAMLMLAFLSTAGYLAFTATVRRASVAANKIAAAATQQV